MSSDVDRHYAVTVESADQLANPVTWSISASGEFSTRLTVTLTLENPDAFPQQVNVAIDGTPPYSSRIPYARALGIRTGVVVRQLLYTEAIASSSYILANHPDVTPVTAFWFGQGSFRNQWQQSAETPDFQPYNYLAFSWQNRVVPAFGNLNLSFIVHSLGEGSSPDLEITNSIPATIENPDNLVLQGVGETWAD
jgi:hypothetical protein